MAIRNVASGRTQSVLQGNIDPVTLFARPTLVAVQTRRFLDELGDRRRKGFIVNLGHGILPGTPPESVSALCEVVAADA